MSTYNVEYTGRDGTGASTSVTAAGYELYDDTVSFYRSGSTVASFKNWVSVKLVEEN